MKKISLILSLIVASVSLFAQTIVSTTSENKKVILEEYTGIHCGYCPSGHKIAADIMKNNPNKVFAVNIHAGNYAKPNANELDFRTNFGDALMSGAGVTGFPMGSVNRKKYTGTSIAMSRDKWNAASNAILSQKAYVNIAATASIDVLTREMTVYVEGYFTDNGAPSTMKLNVAVNQNNIAGTQSGASSNPDQVLADGRYNHSHALRHFITGQWGTVVDTTTKGTFFKRTYTWTIPASIKNIPVELNNLEVIAYIAEGNANIINGNKAAMTIVTPAGINLIDLSAKDVTVTPELCATSITPSIEVTNNSNIAADSFRVSYTYNNGTAVNKDITTSLAAGASTVINFPALTVTDEINNIELSVNTDNNSNLIDIAIMNNIASSKTIYIMPQATMNSMYTEDFENYTSLAETMDNMIIRNTAGGTAGPISKDDVNTSYKLGAFGNSNKSCWVFVNSMPTGEIYEMDFHKMDFSKNTSHGVIFNYAYAQLTSSSNDKLEILVSDDCGQTWTSIWSKSGSALATASPNGQSAFFPRANEWKQVNIDLSSYDGKSEVILSFKVTSNQGNGIYIDDINVYNNINIGYEKLENNNQINLYPNPAEDKFNLNIELAENSNVSYTVLNNIGQSIKNVNLGTQNAGRINEQVDISNLSKGIYMVQININGNITSKKLIVK